MKSLLERLEIEVRLLEALVVVTEEERLALAAGDMERIANCTERKVHIIDAYGSLGVSRDHLIERLPGGDEVLAGRRNLLEFVVENGGEHFGPLRDAVLRIAELGRRMRQLGDTNLVLLQRTLDWTVRTRRALTGDSAPEPVYGRRGGYRPNVSRAAVLRERA